MGQRQRRIPREKGNAKVYSVYTHLIGIQYGFYGCLCWLSNVERG